MAEMFSKRHIVVINFDYIRSGYEGRVPIARIPAFVKFDAQGRATSSIITSAAWSDAVPRDDYRKLSQFFENAEAEEKSDRR